MQIGAHESIAGGLHRAFERAVADGAESLQIFTRSGRQWTGKALENDSIAAFRAAARATGLPVIAHASYLVNLAAPPGEVRTKSLAAFRDELERCETLGIPWLVLHPGSHPDTSEGLELVVEGLRQCLQETAGAQTGVCLEITAGQGNCLGHRFDHLAFLLDHLGQPERSGVCLDSCHLFASGHDLSTPEGYEATIRDFDLAVGLQRLRAWHLNDSKKGLGCRVDRHDHIGDGTLGMGVFSRLVNDDRFKGLPAVLETPEGRWPEEIALLKSLRGVGALTDAALSGAASRPDDAVAIQPTSSLTGRRTRRTKGADDASTN